MSSNEPDNLLEEILKRYQQSFANKVFGEESAEEDDLMLVFGLTQTLKAGNRQYWGRELGMCWQRLISALCRQYCSEFQVPVKEGNDELCDLVVGKDAIDTKYRIGSGDSGTLKKFRQYGQRLQNLGYKPVLLILRTDNLPAAITACASAGWTVYSGENAFDYINKITGFDLKAWLQSKKGLFSVKP